MANLLDVLDILIKSNQSVKMKTAHSTAWKKIPIYCSTSFKWADNQVGTCKKSELIMLGYHDMAAEYTGLLVRSSKTNSLKYFEPVYDEDGYDGEFMVYRCDQIFITIWNY